MSAKYELSEAAQQSVDDIFNYTLDVWGERCLGRSLSPKIFG